MKHLVATAESRGIFVAVRPLEEIDAFSVVTVDRPMIDTPASDPTGPTRGRFRRC